MGTVSKLNQEEIIRYLEEGEIIDQKVFDKLSLEEIQVYFKANMQANDGGLNLNNLKSLHKDIKFPEHYKWLNLDRLKSLHKDIKFPESCKRLYLESLESLPEGIKFPENCEYLYLDSLESLPSDFFKNNPNLKGKVLLKNDKIE